MIIWTYELSKQHKVCRPSLWKIYRRIYKQSVKAESSFIPLTSFEFINLEKKIRWGMLYLYCSEGHFLLLYLVKGSDLIDQLNDAKQQTARRGMKNYFKIIILVWSSWNSLKSVLVYHTFPEKVSPVCVGWNDHQAGFIQSHLWVFRKHLCYSGRFLKNVKTI